MHIAPFSLERWQSVFEHHTEINLSESGVHPLRVSDLVAPGDLEPLLAQELGYTQTNGTLALRERIAALYHNASASNVLVTNGSSEANFVACWHLLEPGDEAVIVKPVYEQITGLTESFGATVHSVWLKPDGAGWRPDLDDLRRAVGPRTRFIAVCNPNNPTGARLDASDVAELARLASEHGCWLLADEVYRGSELDGRDTPTAWDTYDRVLVTGGLSKAYGLPGLRIGWLIGPPTLIELLWGRRDYTSIAPGAINDRLARVALEPTRRTQLLARTRRILNENQTRVADWVATQTAAHQIPPEAGGVTLIGYAGSDASTGVTERLRTEHGVLCVPGSHFGLDHSLRIGIGGPPAPLVDGLARLGHVMDTFA
ncbi:MAG: aminotransferase class I/II-fold pyridoxal phosphate-dependent enzyme [Acidobacteriota bacterium]|nr:aminotransferase class I/II-fold pyridoxal phosphate-dependent enzyme [Acidobacteriota bacterium]